MEEYDIIELNDFNFNHIVHHCDEDIMEMMEYAQEHGTIDAHTEYFGAVYWDEN